MLTLYGTGKEEHFGDGCVCLKTKDSEFLFCFVFFLPSHPFFLPKFALLTGFPSVREWVEGGRQQDLVGICVARAKSLP